MLEENTEKKVVMSLRVDKKLKSLMENHPEIKWSEIIEQALQRKLFENDELRLDEFLKRMLEHPARMLVLHMMATIEDKGSLYETVRMNEMVQVWMPGSEPTEIISRIEKDLHDNGFSIDDYPTRDKIRMKIDEDPEFIKIIRDCIREKIKEDHIKKGVWLLSSYVDETERKEFLFIHPEGLDRSYQILTSSTEKISDELVRIGFLYKDHYSSNAYFHPLYRIPKYICEAGLLSYEPIQPYEIKTLFQDPKIREFLKVIGRNSFIEEYNEDEIIKKESNGSLTDEDITMARQRLIAHGALVLDYSPYRRRVGKRKSDPARWVYRLTKNTLVALGEYVLKNYGEKL